MRERRREDGREWGIGRLGDGVEGRIPLTSQNKGAEKPWVAFWNCLSTHCGPFSFWEVPLDRSIAMRGVKLLIETRPVDCLGFREPWWGHNTEATWPSSTMASHPSHSDGRSLDLRWSQSFPRKAMPQLLKSPLQHLLGLFVIKQVKSLLLLTLEHSTKSYPHETQWTSTWSSWSLPLWLSCKGLTFPVHHFSI